MTLNTTDSKIVYAGDGSTTAFAVPFKFLANGDVTAMVSDDATGVESDWVENTHFTLTGAGIDAGGTLTVSTGPTDHTPRLGQTLVIRRVAAETQGAAFPAGGAFPSATVETALDRLTMLVQQHSESIGRALVAPAADSPDSIGELPPSVARASRFLAFDAAGNPIASAGTSASLGPVSSFVDTLLDDADAAAARTTLGFSGAGGTAASGNIAPGAVSLDKLEALPADGRSLALGRGPLISGVIVPSVAAGALTLAIKNRVPSTLNADPSAANPVVYTVRSAIDTTVATYNVKSLTAALSLTVPSGATLGAASGTAFRLWIVAVADSGGTGVLGVVNCRSGTDIYPLGRAASATSVAIDATADSAHVFYTDAVQTARPYTILGYLEWSSGLTTAGTWDALPDICELFGPHTPLPGATIQSVGTPTSAVVATTGTAIPVDDTKPQNDEGDEILTQAITPTSKANVLRHHGVFNLSGATGDVNCGLAMFQDATADALVAVQWFFHNGLNPTIPIVLEHEMPAGTTSATTFKIRAGGNTGQVMTLNGFASARKFGGIQYSALRIREIMA